MKPMTTITNALESLRSSSDESIDNGKPVKIPEAMQPGDMFPQGDIALFMIQNLPPSCEVIPWPENGQLAPGTSRGSRHCIPQQFHADITLYRVDDGNALSDLCLDARAPFDLVHPEHSDHIGYPAAKYRVLHQQNAMRDRVVD